jgi:hypothetical protein
VGRNRRSTGGTVGLIVVVGIVLVGWVASGNGPDGPTGNADLYAVPDVDATPLPGDEPPRPARPRPGTVRVDSFRVEAPGRLVLTYTAACLHRTDLVESDVAVTVTLRVDRSTSCVSAAVGTVRVTLDVPLGDRSVLDGSLPRPSQVPRG